MARKNINVYEVATAQDMSTDFITRPTVISYMDNCSYQIDITTTDSIGSFAVQASDNYKESEPSGTVTNPGTWVDLPLGGGTPFSNAADDDILINLNQLPFVAIRIAYTAATPGTGTCDITIVTKQIGG